MGNDVANLMAKCGAIKQTLSIYISPFTTLHISLSVWPVCILLATRLCMLSCYHVLYYLFVLAGFVAEWREKAPEPGPTLQPRHQI